jgi:hypothetical protein
MDVGRAAGQQYAVEAGDQVRQVVKLAEGRNHEGQAVGRLGDRPHVLVPHCMERLFLDLLDIGRHADDGQYPGLAHAR